MKYLNDILLDKIEQLPCEEIKEEKYLESKEKVDKNLTDLGYKGNLKERIDNWLEDGFLKKDDVIDYAKKFIDKIKEKT